MLNYLDLQRFFVVEPNVDRHEIAKIIGAHPITPQQMSIVIDYTEKKRCGCCIRSSRYGQCFTNSI